MQKDYENIIIIPALTGLGAPYWQPDVRGAIFGLTRDTSIAEIVKATLDSLCYQTFDLVDSMQKDSNIKISEINVDGGMADNQKFIQNSVPTCQWSKGLQKSSFGKNHSVPRI